MHKILQNHLLCAFVADLKIDALYALYPESFCDQNLATRKVFAFCDSVYGGTTPHCPTSISISFISFHRAEGISLQAFGESSTCIVYKKDPLPRVNSLLEIHKM